MESPTLQVERLLSAEQKSTDYRSPDDGIAPDHRPTNACTRYILLTHLELVFWIKNSDIFVSFLNGMDASQYMYNLFFSRIIWNIVLVGFYRPFQVWAGYGISC